MSDCDKMRAAGHVFDCCPCCHDDWQDMSYEMCHFTLDGVDLHVCCQAKVSPSIYTLADKSGVSTEGASWAMEGAK